MAIQSQMPKTLFSLLGEVEDAAAAAVLFAAVRFMGHFHPVLEHSEAAHFHPDHCTVHCSRLLYPVSLLMINTKRQWSIQRSSSRATN